MQDIYYLVEQFDYNKETRTFTQNENKLFTADCETPFPNEGKQFYIKNKGTKDYRRFRLEKQDKEYYYFTSEDGIKCIITKFNVLNKEEVNKKRLELLNETISFYNSNNRCVADNLSSCLYHKEGSAGCAIGRYIEDKELCVKLDNMGSVSNKEVFDLLPKKLTILGQGFLSSIQGLHDDKECWEEDGLSEEGKKRVISIKGTFGLI